MNDNAHVLGCMKLPVQLDKGLRLVMLAILLELRQQIPHF